MSGMTDLDSRVRLAPPKGIRALVRRHGTVVLGEPVYCMSCGKQDGYVTVDLPLGVFDLCGDCETKYGVPEVFTPRPDLEQARVG